MARRALISDIHGNLPALLAVLADIQTQNADEIVCLGDICGYGPQPAECLDLVRERAAWSLKGNHDQALFEEPFDFGRNALAAIHWQRRLMAPVPGSPADVCARWEWLRALPVQRQEKDVRFVHASPRDELYEYVLREDFDAGGLGPAQKAKDIMSAVDWLCFCGHSHRPGVVAEDYKWVLPEEMPASGQVLRRGFKTIVNIGSVGQPRDGNPDACYCLFDYTPPDPNKTTRVAAPPAGGPTMILKAEKEETRRAGDLQHARDTVMLSLPRVTFRRVPYDIAETQRRFKAVPELPENNSKRLATGL